MHVVKPLRIALCDDPGSSPWADAHHCLEPLKQQFESHGYDVALIDARDCSSTSFLTGLSREKEARPLISSAKIAEYLVSHPFDFCIFPSRDGLAHSTLMARACGEISQDAIIMIWADSTYGSLEVEPWARRGMAAIVGKALHSFAVKMADGILLPEPIDPEPFQSNPNIVRLSPEADLTANYIVCVDNSAIKEIVFIGPLTRQAGLVSFIEAIESLAKDGSLENRHVRFIGVFDDYPMSVDREWFGRRAAAWAFQFDVFETSMLQQALERGVQPGCLTFAAGAGLQFLHALQKQRKDRVAAILLSRQSVAKPGQLKKTLSAMLDERCVSPVHNHTLEDLGSNLPSWRSFNASVPREKCSKALSFCILHFDRPDYLKQAVESVLREDDGSVPFELIIVDNASPSKAAKTALSELRENEGITIIELGTSVPYSSALNIAARQAKYPFLVFLDDDNALVAGGMKKLSDACGLGKFDVITSNLELFEGQDVSSPSFATMTFIGPAGTAGLFFNGFGDNCMAIRRDSFFRLGGFVEEYGAYPCADWILLARAQAEGIRIGVMQMPVFRYRCNPSKSEVHWQRYDLHAVRSMLLKYWGDELDSKGVAQIAQAMYLELNNF